MTPWSERKKWWLDVVKSIVTLCIASFVGYHLLDDLREERDEAVFLRHAQLEARVAALQDFERTSIEYVGAGHGAFVDLYQWSDCSPQTPSMLLFLGSANVGRQLAMEKVKRLFKGESKISQHVEAFDAACTQYWRVFDTVWDRRLDACHGMPIGEKSHTPEQIWNEANEARDEHEKALEAVRSAQSAVSAAAEPLLSAVW